MRDLVVYYNKVQADLNGKVCKVPRDDFQPLIDGDTERFGPARGQLSVWAAGQGKVELAFDDRGSGLILDALSLKDLTYWLESILLPSIENINACVEAEPDAGE